MRPSGQAIRLIFVVERVQDLDCVIHKHMLARIHGHQFSPQETHASSGGPLSRSPLPPWQAICGFPQ